jgi:hypothetical protein
MHVKFGQGLNIGTARPDADSVTVSARQGSTSTAPPTSCLSTATQLQNKFRRESKNMHFGMKAQVSFLAVAYEQEMSRELATQATKTS